MAAVTLNSIGRRLGMVFAVCLLVSFVSGCGPADWHAKTHPATGRVTINGEPPVGALVQLNSIGAPPDIRNSIPWGLVQEDGSYSLSTYETEDGAPPGEYAITLTWPWDPSKASFTERLNNAYNDPAKSQWKATITSGTNELPVVEIVGAKILRKESRQGEP